MTGILKRDGQDPNPWDNLARRYDEYYVNPQELAEDAVLGSMLKSCCIKRGRVLDVGCGTGHLLELAEIHPCRYFGIDIAENMISRCSLKYPTHSFVHLDATGIVNAPGLRNQFKSAIVLFCTINYSKNLLTVLEGLYEALRSRGDIFLMFYGVRRLVEHKYVSLIHDAGCEVNTAYYAPEEIFGALAAAGFLDIEIRGLNLGVLHRYIKNQRLLNAMMSIESSTIGRLIPEAFRYMVVTGKKR